MNLGYIISAIYCTSLPITIRSCQLLYLAAGYFTITLPAVCRKCHTPGHYRSELFIRRSRTPLGQYGQEIKQISVNIETVPFGCLNDAHNCCTCICALYGIAEQEILSVDDIRLDRSLGKIVGHFNVGIVKKQIQLFFLILGISDRLAKVRSLARSECIYDLIYLVEQRLLFPGTLGVCGGHQRAAHAAQAYSVQEIVKAD